MIDTLKNMVTSVDWKNLLHSSDAKNALIGSALGGLVLGGAGLAADRDPEESKLAPVGDALTGALLGGIAGYGIPKGLSLFYNGGKAMAPESELEPTTIPSEWNSPWWAAAGGTAGAGLIGASLLKTYSDARRSKVRGAKRRLRADSNAAETAWADADREVTDWRKAHPDARLTDDLMDKLNRAHDNRMAFRDQAAVDNYVYALRSQARQEKLRGHADVAEAIRQRAKEVERKSRTAKYGYTSHRELTNYIGDARVAPGEHVFTPARILTNLLHPKKAFSAFNSAAHYGAPRGSKWLGFIPRGPRGRMAMRAGRYGAAGALLGTLLGFGHDKLFGHNPDNFKN